MAKSTKAKTRKRTATPRTAEELKRESKGQEYWCKLVRWTEMVKCIRDLERLLDHAITDGVVRSRDNGKEAQDALLEVFDCVVASVPLD